MIADDLLATPWFVKHCEENEREHDMHKVGSEDCAKGYLGKDGWHLDQYCTVHDCFAGTCTDSPTNVYYRPCVWAWVVVGPPITDLPSEQPE